MDICCLYVCYYKNFIIGKRILNYKLLSLSYVFPKIKLIVNPSFSWFIYYRIVLIMILRSNFMQKNFWCYKKPKTNCRIEISRYFKRTPIIFQKIIFFPGFNFVPENNQQNIHLFLVFSRTFCNLSLMSFLKFYFN